jgi:hypothetical protein
MINVQGAGSSRKKTGPHGRSSITANSRFRGTGGICLRKGRGGSVFNRRTPETGGSRNIRRRREQIGVFHPDRSSFSLNEPARGDASHELPPLAAEPFNRAVKSPFQLPMKAVLLLLDF